MADSIRVLHKGFLISVNSKISKWNSREEILPGTRTTQPRYFAFWGVHVNARIGCRMNISFCNGHFLQQGFGLEWLAISLSLGSLMRAKCLLGADPHAGKTKHRGYLFATTKGMSWPGWGTLPLVPRGWFPGQSHTWYMGAPAHTAVIPKGVLLICFCDFCVPNVDSQMGIFPIHDFDQISGSEIL